MSGKKSIKIPNLVKGWGFLFNTIDIRFAVKIITKTKNFAN